MKPDRAVYSLELRGEPGNWRAPEVVRLRALLKTALRRFGFRCLSVSPKPRPSEPDAEKNKAAPQGAARREQTMPYLAIPLRQRVALRPTVVR
jgi:hypothetical protein